MATNTTNFGFKKPDESDFYSIGDQNNNWDKVDEELHNLDAPTFEDYTGSTAVPTAAAALEGIKSKGKLATLLSNIKAFAKGCCTLAMIVDNCTTNRPDLPGSAAQLKVLMDLYTQLNSDLLASYIEVFSNGDRAELISGGYKKIGNVVFVNLSFTSKLDVTSAEADFALITGIPIASLYYCPLSCYNSTKKSIISAKATNGGNINFGGIISVGDVVCVSGCYVVA